MSFHSDRHGGELHFGKTAATTPRFTVYEDDLRPKLKAKGLLPPTPAMFGHGHDFPPGAWRMLGNGPDDTVAPGFGGCGDCAWADPAHDEMEAGKDAGRSVPPVSSAVRG